MQSASLGPDEASERAAARRRRAIRDDARAMSQAHHVAQRREAKAKDMLRRHVSEALRRLERQGHTTQP